MSNTNLNIDDALKEIAGNLPAPKTAPLLNNRQDIQTQAIEMYLAGKPVLKIKKFYVDAIQKIDPEYNPHAASYEVKSLIKDVRARLNKDKENVASDIYAKLNYIYELAVEDNDLSNARACLNDIAKITGVTSGNSVEIKNDEQEIKISFA